MKINFPKIFCRNYISFKGKDESPQITMNVLRGLENVTCAYCGEVMPSSRQVQKFAVEASLIKDRKLARYLSGYEHYMKSNERQALFFIKDALERFPHCNLKEILEVIFPYHVARLEQQQKAILDKMQSLAGGFSFHDRDLTLELVKKGRASIGQKSDMRHFKRNRFITEFYNLKEQFENPRSHVYAMDVISSMPSTHTSTDAFLVKYKRKECPEIAARLLSPAQVTVEHLVPQSQGGKNNIENLVLACGEDNSTRRSQPLDTMPQIRLNLPHYCKTVKKELLRNFDKGSVNYYLRSVWGTVDSLLSGGIHIYKKQ